MVNMDSDLIKWLASLGVGGSIAGMIFLFYRKDVKSYTDLWEKASIMLGGLLKESTAAHIENSQSNREMIVLLRAVHKRLDEDWKDEMRRRLKEKP